MHHYCIYVNAVCASDVECHLVKKWSNKF